MSPRGVTVATWKTPEGDTMDPSCGEGLWELQWVQSS